MDVVTLHREAERFRRLARGINDDALAAELERLAREMEQRAAQALPADRTAAPPRSM